MKRWMFCAALVACAPRVDPWDNREPDDSVPVVEGDGVFHQVGKGETPYRIAAAYGLAVEDLLGINGIEDARRVRAGDYLFVPGAKQVAVVKQPTLKQQVTESKETVERLAENMGKLGWPVDGIVTSKFGVRGSRKHDGIDIAAPEGTKVLAAERGVVLYAGDGIRGYGNLVMVKHDGGIVTVYAHNRENVVKEGQSLARGQHIANVGHTGRADAPHVHFEVRALDKPKNPLLFLP